MTHIAIIPARGGSESIPRKNLLHVADKTLLKWTIDAAKASKEIEEIYVTTDDDEIKGIAWEEDVDSVIIRPPELAANNVHAIHAVIHALDDLGLGKESPNKHETISMLLPTSPFRTAEDIDHSIQTFIASDCDAVIGISNEIRKEGLRYIESGEIHPIVDETILHTQRQDADLLYSVNGAIFVSTASHIKAHKSFHRGGRIVPILMPKWRSIEIDTYDDLNMAKVLAELWNLK